MLVELSANVLLMDSEVGFTSLTRNWDHDRLILQLLNIVQLLALCTH